MSISMRYATGSPCAILNPALIAPIMLFQASVVSVLMLTPFDISAQSISVIQNGHVYKEQSRPEFYLIKDSKKLWIPSMNVLANLGFTTAQVNIVPDGSLKSIALLPNLNGPVLDALNMPADGGKVTPSDVFFGSFQSFGPWPVNGNDTQKDPNSIVIRNFYVAGWVAQNGDGRGPFAHCKWPDGKNPLCIEDFLYEVQLDPDFLNQMYGPDGLLAIPNSVVLRGNPSANAKVLPFVNIDAGGALNINSMSLFNGGDVTLHVELNSWHVKSTGYLFYQNWVGRGPAPAGWVHWDGDNTPWGKDALQDQRAAQAQNWWPYYPYDPDGLGALQVGQYVIMRGTIWQDKGHDEAANGNSDMDMVGLTGQGAWLEMHPPDAIIRSRPANCADPLGSCKTKRAFVVNVLNGADQPVSDQQIEIETPPRPPSANSTDSYRINFEEHLDPRFSTPSQIITKDVLTSGDTLRLHLRLENVGLSRGMFKATYLTWWELVPVTPPAPAKVRVSPGSIDFGQQPIDIASAAHQITVSNSGGTAASLNISAPDPFGEKTTCGATLPAGASCTVSVFFTPAGPGMQSRVLTFGPGLPQVGLSGIGFDPAR